MRIKELFDKGYTRGEIGAIVTLNRRTVEKVLREYYGVPPRRRMYKPKKERDVE